MTIQEKALCHVLLPQGMQNIYTVPPGRRAIIKYIRVSNVSVTQTQFKIWARPGGDETLGEHNSITPYLIVKAGSMFSDVGFFPFEEGWEILAEATVADRLTIWLFGAEIF